MLVMKAPGRSCANNILPGPFMGSLTHTVLLNAGRPVCVRGNRGLALLILK